MSAISIPERLKNRMSQDDKWLKCALQLRDNIEPFLLKDPDFFPDYTLHGIQHINRVLKLADQLISCDTLAKKIDPKDSDIEKYGLLKPRDVAFLVCGILLHDMGMYLRPDGLKKLITQETPEDAFGGKPWNQEWSDYVDRTKRLSQEKMRYHFGKVIPVTADCVDHADTDDNKRIIGEFLRQHHARLAHEFATGVLHGSTDADLFDNTDLKKKDRMMIGLLARSHGMSIRDTEEYLKSKFGDIVNPYKLPVFYLMTVLRIADYLDADGQRAPKQLTQQQKINVPISVAEWTWNQCINADATDFDQHHNNYHVEAEPETSRQYVQLDKWLKNVQADLDMCWSILVEKYPYDRYRLSIHRVVSNIHQPDHIKELNNTFLTKEAKISANPEIVKLMMEPLYGDEPTYGVRELLQNAVDSCLERKDWEEKHGDKDYKGLVDIRIENGVFTITDNGMGMDEDVLLNYYLSAGSSYRRSDAWAAAYTRDGKSQVSRTGKFGVGFLAAFLLGDEVEIHTQHLKDAKGLHFTFSQEPMPLDVERRERRNPYVTETNDPTRENDRTHSGTTITIKLKDIAVKNWGNRPEWYNWYAFEDPVVRYSLDDIPQQHQKLKLNRPPVDTPGWFRLPTGDYESYHWRPNLDTSSPEIYCNGIRIEHPNLGSLDHSGLKVPYPHISIVDKQGKLGVDLARKKLKEIPEKTALVRSVLRWHIHRLLLTPWESEADHWKNLLLGFTLQTNIDNRRIPFLLTPGGFSLNCAPLLAALSLGEYVILCNGGHTALEALPVAWNLLGNVPCTIAVTDVYHQKDYAELWEENYYYDAPGQFASQLLLSNTGLFNPGNIGYDVWNNIGAVWLHPDVPATIPEKTWKNIELQPTNQADHFFTYSFHSRSSAMPLRPDTYPASLFPAAVHVKPGLGNTEILDAAESLFAQVLRETLQPAPGWPQDLWIPYRMEDRQAKFPGAFAELEKYTASIQEEQHQETLRNAEMAKRAAFRRAEMEKLKEKFAAQITQQQAEEARQEELRTARLQAFRAAYLSHITAFHAQTLRVTLNDLPRILSAFLAKLLAAHYLNRTIDSIPQVALQEATELILSACATDDEDLSPEDFLKDFLADPEELVEVLFDSLDEKDMDALRKVAEENHYTALLLDILTRLQNTLPEA